MSTVVQFPEPVRYVRFEDVLDRSSTWLEGVHQLVEARAAQSCKGRVTIPADEAQDIAEGLRIIVANLNAMRASLDQG